MSLESQLYSVNSSQLWGDSHPMLLEATVLNSLLGYLGPEDRPVFSPLRQLFAERVFCALKQGIKETFQFNMELWVPEPSDLDDRCKKWADFVAKHLPDAHAYTQMLQYKDPRDISRNYVFNGEARCGWLILDSEKHDVPIRPADKGTRISFAVNVLTGKLCSYKEINENEENCLQQLSEVPHIAPALALVFDPCSQQNYLIQKYQAAGDLHQFLNRLVPDPVTGKMTRKFDLLTLRQRMKLGIDALQAVTKMHASHIVHADLKPQNILVEENPMGRTVELIDFDRSGRDGHQIYFGGIFGYMPHDSFAGKKVAFTDDAYAIGIILYELLMGDHPHLNWMKKYNLSHYQIQVSRMEHPLARVEGYKRFSEATESDSPIHYVIYNLLRERSSRTGDRISCKAALSILEGWYSKAPVKRLER